MNLSDLRKKPVVSMADGAKIGEVDDLVIDTGAWAVRELYVASKTGRGLLALASLKNIGPDAVTVERLDVVAWNAKSAGLCFDAMKKLIVVDGTGTTIGHVADVVFDPDGAVRTFEVRQGGVLGLGVHVTTLTPADVRGVGEKLITVDLPTEAPSVEAPKV